MNYKEAERIFISREGDQILADCLAELKNYFKAHKQRIGDEFVESFHIAAEEMRRLSFRPKYCIYTIFRTDFLEDKYRYLVKVYDDKWYYGQEPYEALDYDVEWGFQFFRLMWNRLKIESKRYMGKADKAFIDNLAMLQMMEFNNLIGKLFIESGIIGRIKKEECWEDINPSLELYMGEYMGMVFDLLN